MDRKSRLKSSLGNFLRSLFDLMVLNIVWFLCSIPVFTIGPATSALCRVMIKQARDESPTSILKEFFSAFRSDFGKAVVLGLLSLIGAAVAASDYLYAVSLDGLMKALFLIVAVIVGSIVASFASYAFPLHAFYGNTVSGHIKNALALAASCPVETVQIWICFAVPAASLIFLPEIVIVYLGFLYILFGISAPAWFAAKYQAKVLAKFVGTQGQQKEWSER